MGSIRSFDSDVENAVERVRTDKQLCEENRKLILEFSEKCFADGLSKGRICKVLYVIRYLAGYLVKPFNTATKLDIQNVVAKIERQEKYSEWTKYDFKVILKKFYKWHKGDDELYPPEVRWIKPRIRGGKKVLPDDLISEEEIKRMGEKATHPRDRAFVMMLYESGCRVGEIITLKIKNIQFDEFGAVLRVSGKTGDRRVRIVSTAPLLASWIDVHPDRSNGEAPLWAGRYKRYSHENFTYETAVKRLKELALSAGIKRRVYPHLFRHSRATSLASKLTEAQMKEHFGWVQSSRMASVYVHLSGRDVDEALLRTYGIKKDGQEQVTELKLKTCPRCKSQSSPISKFCQKCGSVLELETVVQIEDERTKANSVLNELMKDKETREFLMKRLTDLGVAKTLV